MGSINAKARATIFKFAEKSKRRIHEMTRWTLIEIGRRLVMRSVVGNPMLWHPPVWPKGYHPGRFINNWQVGIDQMPSGTIPTVDPSGKGSIERMKKVGRWPAGHSFYFANNLPYAYALESGLHSTQQPIPQGIVGLTKSEFPVIVKMAAEWAKANVNS